ncbi:hypothetical protein HO173_012125 [Letharia columbiana]|uniref:WW domain-containing protein n=1 Tax=Letharia columbiana TaxID=112416 RepID=A0A8H6CQV4_9LECA|nr:uncharacterized protein HO173_012125 [Letharia columbiana]KAF6227596.1 hypothetical protein HO173_012125 [Letharia columbiana]
MAKRKTREEDVTDSQDQDDHDHKSPATDNDNEGQSSHDHKSPTTTKDNESQTLPPLSHATQSREKKRAKGDASKGEAIDRLKTTHLSKKPLMSLNVGKARRSRVRKSGDTEYCGIPSERIRTPEPAARSTGDYFCIICRSRFTRAEGVNYHFGSCVRRFGNPYGNRWNDHPSCAPKGTRTNDVATGPSNSAAYLDLEEGEQGVEQEAEAAVPIRYDPTTLASDFLRAIGEHPTLPALNAHMEGIKLVSEPSARGSLLLRFQFQKPSTEGQGNDEAENVGVEQEATAAKRKAFREKREVERKARIEAEEESNPMTPRQSSRPSLSQDPSGNGPLSQNPRASQPGVLPSEWMMRRTNAGLVHYVHQHTQIITLDDPRLTTQPRAIARHGGLPSGWTISLMDTANGPRVYFVDHNTRRNTWDDPRGPS